LDLSSLPFQILGFNSFFGSKLLSKSFSITYKYNGYWIIIIFGT
jgi:hypothetical protein